MPEEVAQLRKRLTTLHKVRMSFRSAMADPLRRSIMHPNALVAAQRAWELPLELAAAGFSLTIEHRTDRWFLELKRRIDSEVDLAVVSSAASLLPALVQLSEETETQVSYLESKTRDAIGKMEAAAIVAA